MQGHGRRFHNRDDFPGAVSSCISVIAGAGTLMIAAMSTAVSLEATESFKATEAGSRADSAVSWSQPPASGSAAKAGPDSMSGRADFRFAWFEEYARYRGVPPYKTRLNG